MNTIKRLLGITFALTAFAFASSVQAQQTLSATVTLSPANEVPPVTGPNATATGTATITITPTLDVTGVITGGSVRFQVTATFPNPQGNVNGLHIHQAPAGTNGPIVIPTDVSDASAILASGTVTIDRTVSNVSAALIQGLIASPAGFYTNLHTTANPGGAMRGQLDSIAAVPLTGITCHTVCFRSPTFFAAQLALNPINNIPVGLIFIPGDNANGPVLTTAPFKPFLILYMLKPLNSLAIPFNNPFLRLRRVFIALQLSLLPGNGFTKGPENAILNSTLACHGITINPIVLSNGALITNNTSLLTLFLQVQQAFKSNNVADMNALATVLELLTAGSTFGACQ